MMIKLFSTLILLMSFLSPRQGVSSTIDLITDRDSSSHDRSSNKIFALANAAGADRLITIRTEMMGYLGRFAALMPPAFDFENHPGYETCGNQIAFAFNNPDESSTTEVWRSRDADSGFELIATEPGSGGYLDANLESNKTYYYKLRAVTQTDQSEFSETAALTSGPKWYYPLFELTLLPDNTVQGKLTDRSFLETDYEIHWGISPDGFFTTTSMTDSGRVFTFTDATVQPGQTYQYDVHAVMPPACGNSIWAATETITIPGSTFTLVDADTDDDIKNISEGEVITKNENDNINIRYNPEETAGSVVFHVNGVKTRTETAPPYALAGDVNGDYAPWQGAKPGTYELTATPYSEAGGQGTPGTPLTVNFTIKSETGGANCTASGSILREQWNNVSGNSVSAIPLNTPPSSTSQLNLFEGPTNANTNFGARIRGYICPPTTGNYTFWIASNDNSELWLSIDDNPSNKLKIASVTGAATPRQWTKFPSQKSAAINLTAGRRYYIEALHKQGAGSHNIAVGWQLPDGTLERPIAGSRLSPFSGSGNQRPSVVITSPRNGQEFNSPATVIIQANASDADGTIGKVEFYQKATDEVNYTKLGEDLTSPYSYTWSDVDFGNYNVRVVAYDAQGANQNSEVVIHVSGACAASGTITREYWNNAPGSRVSDIPVDRPPSGSQQLTIFEGPTNNGTNYGARIRGYICAPQSGNYIFYLSSNDHSQLWLSTSDDPSEKQMIAYVIAATGPREWTRWGAQQSRAIKLDAGQSYYIEALHKQGAGAAHVAVGWQLPDGTMQRPIPGNRLSPFEMSAARMASADDNTTSGEKALYSKINIYPNPVESGDPELTIAGYERVAEPVETDIEIINMTGEVVFADRIRCGGNCGTYLMNVNKVLVPGIYLVNIKTNDLKISKRLLVK